MEVDSSEKVAANSEEGLLRGARRGGTKAFSALVEAHQEKMIHTAYSFLGSMEDAEDIAQEAFVKAYESLHSFNEKSRFSTWLYRILINRCKDFLRRKKVRQHLHSFLGTKTEEDSDPAEEVQASGRDARQELSDRELETEIHKALGQLPFQQRSVFTLKYLEGFKLEEIAESLDLSLGAVKAHLWQAVQKMRRMLSRQFPVEEGLR